VATLIFIFRASLPLLVFGLGLTAALTGVGCEANTAGQARRNAARPAAVPVQTTTVQRISVQRQVALAGTLMSPDQAKVSSEVAGVVRQVLVQIGQEVPAGQVLVRLEPRELELALQRAQSALSQTEAQLGMDRVDSKEPPPDDQIASVRTAAATRDDARAQLARADQLVSRGLLPPVERENAQTRMKVAEAAYQSAIENVHALKAALQDRRAAVQLAQKKLNDAAVRAPVAGSISERLVQPGEFIRENTPVVTIVQMHPLKLRTAVQERHAGQIQPGLPVRFRVESFPDTTFEGKVAYVSPAVDQATRTFAVEALVDNSDRRLKPGFFAKGTILTQLDQNVLAIAEDAVSTLAGVSTVYVIDNNKARSQTIITGVHQGGLVEVVAGLKGDETLATSNLTQLANGVAVTTGAAGDAAGAGDRSGRPGEGGRTKRQGAGSPEGRR
jgi:RND family efflux transporter MFP subunit